MQKKYDKGSLRSLTYSGKQALVWTSLGPQKPHGYHFVLLIMYYQMQQKVVTSEIFRGKKEGYAESLNQPFADSRIGKSLFSSMCSLPLFKKKKKVKGRYLIRIS